MSIKYGKSKRQYVKGKRVENLTVYVDTDKVCVEWDDIDESIERRDKGHTSDNDTS